MQLIIVPTLSCPFPVAVNPHGATVQQKSITWAQRVQLIPDDAGAARRLAATNLNGLAARLHPQATHDVLQLVVEWYVWGFVRDDLCDESELGIHPPAMMALNARCLAILQGASPTPHDHALTHALADLWQRMVPYTTRIWRQRFTRSVREYLDATVWEAINRVQQTIPDVATYCRMRRLTSALQTDTDLIELTTTRLPLDVHQHPVVQRLTHAATNVVCWANDIASLSKEVHRGDMHNLVVVLHHAHGGSMQAAVDRAATMHDAEVQIFLDLSRRLPTFSPAVDRNVTGYIDALRARMGGSVDWGAASGRYQPSMAAGVDLCFA
jgi:5-epi-alpha-selinene synthase